jgi:hypothetical protein
VTFTVPCRLSNPLRNECFTRMINQFINSSNSEGSIFETMELNLPETPFIPIDGEVSLSNVKIRGLNGLRIRSLLVNSINFASRGEVTFDMSLYLPRSGILADFTHPEFNGQFQIMQVDYAILATLNAKVINGTNPANQYLQFTSVRFTQVMRKFKMDFSDATPQSYGKRSSSLSVMSAKSNDFTVNYMKMSIEDAAEICLENLGWFNTLLQNTFLDLFNPLFEFMPYTVFFSP